MGTRTYFPFSSGLGSNVSETQWAQMARYWLDTGVVRGYLNTLQVYGDSTGMQVKVKSGRAWIDGFFFQDDGSPSDTVLAVAAADPTNPRVDLVVARLDHTIPSIAYVVLTGTPAGSPVAPTPTQVAGGRWELPLATVAVAAAASTIAAGNVTDQRTYTHSTADLGAVLTGTAQAFGAVFYPTTDTGFHLDLVSSDPRMIFDTNDYLWYLRSTNVWTVVIGGNSVITIDANGKITGKGFYDSGEVAVTSGSAATVSHGLANRPRVVTGFYNTATGNADSKTTPIANAFSSTVGGIATVSATQLITGTNSTGSTKYVNLYAQD